VDEVLSLLLVAAWQVDGVVGKMLADGYSRNR
jgi:hypothetical protein